MGTEYKQIEHKNGAVTLVRSTSKAWKNKAEMKAYKKARHKK